MGSKIFENDIESVIQEHPELLNQVLSNRVLITGGSGFVGRWVVSVLARHCELAGLRDVVTSVSRAKAPWQQRFVESGVLRVVSHDIQNELPATLGAHGLVIHCATPASAQFNTANPSGMYSVILKGAHTVADYAKLHSSRVVNISSGAVYGNQLTTTERLSEDGIEAKSPQFPDSAYHRGKYDAELVFNHASIASQIEVVHARLFAFVAPFLPLDTHFAVGNFILDAIQGNQIQIKGDSRAVRSYMYGTDLVEWIFKIGVNGASGSAYNVGSPEAVTIGQLAQLIKEVSKSVPKVSEVGRPNLSMPPHRYVPSVTRAQIELGLKVKVPIVSALDRTVRWARESR